MTIRQAIAMILESHLLRPDDIKAILELSEKNIESMDHRWDDEVSDYPQALMVVLWMGVKKHTLEYLEDHKPDHIAIGLFKDPTQ